MKLLIALLVLAFSLPVAAQDKKADKKSAATKKAEKKPARKAEKKEKTQAQPKQEWGRFSSQARSDEKERAQKKAAK